MKLKILDVCRISRTVIFEKTNPAMNVAMGPHNHLVAVTATAHDSNNFPQTDLVYQYDLVFRYLEGDNLRRDGVICNSGSYSNSTGFVG